MLAERLAKYGVPYTRVYESTFLREEQSRVARFDLVPDRDMAGARGAALAAMETVPRS